MKILHYSWDDKNTIESLQSYLNQGLAVVSTTDTVLGLLAPLTPTGFSALNRIKGRQNKPYLIVVSDSSKIGHFADISTISESAQCLIAQCWPGPLTIIFKALPEVPDFMKSQDGTIAIRVPCHAGLLELLTHFPGLFSTSANLAGNPVPNTIDELDPALIRQVACVVNGTPGQDQPSTMIDCSDDTVRIVREGAYSKEELSRLCGLRFH